MAKSIGAFIALIIGLPSLIALLLTVANIPKFSTNSPQNVANIANYTQQATQALVVYSLPWWLPLLGLGILGASILTLLALVFGRSILEG